VSARSAVQESPKTRSKRYENGVFGPRTGCLRVREGVFQQADPFHAVSILENGCGRRLGAV